MIRMHSLPRLLVTVALACLAVPAVDAATNQAQAYESASDLEVGTELLALDDFTVHQAEIAKGSRVSVTKLVKRSGRLDRVHVALPDGHVVKMPIRMVRSYFRVVAD
jgi:hypothetical protein